MLARPRHPWLFGTCTYLVAVSPPGLGALLDEPGSRHLGVEAFTGEDLYCACARDVESAGDDLVNDEGAAVSVQPHLAIG